MNSEEELSQEEVSAALGRPRPKWVKVAAVSVGSFALLSVVYLFALKPDGNSVHEQPDLAVVTSQENDSTLLEELFGDTLELDTGLFATVEEDSLDEMVKRMTNAPIDSTEDIPIPGIGMDELMVHFAAIVDPEDAVLDPDLELEQAISSPMKTGHEIEMPLFHWKKEPDTTIQQPIVSPDPQLKASLDSLSIQLAESDKALARITKENRILSDRNERYAGKIDSSRASEIKRFAKILETMKPGAAAAMLATRSPAEAAEILFKVKPRTAAAIMEQLPPQLTIDIAARVVRR